MLAISFLNAEPLITKMVMIKQQTLTPDPRPLTPESGEK